MPLRIKYKGAKVKVSAVKFAELVTLGPAELAKYLHKKGLINPSIDISKVTAYWQNNNTILLYWMGHMLTGKISLPKRL